MKIKPHHRTAFQRDLRLSIILIALFLLAFAMHLVFTPQSLTLTVISLVGALLVVLYGLLGNPTLVKNLRSSPQLIRRIFIIGLPILWLFSQIYALSSGRWSLLDCAGSLVWLTVIASVAHAARRSKVFFDWLIVLIVWLPLEFSMLRLLLPKISPLANFYAMIGLAILVVYFVVVRQQEIGLTFRLKGEDYRQIVLNFMILFMAAVIIGVLTKLMTVSNRLPTIAEMLMHLAFIFFLIALPEELLFRGVMYKLVIKSVSGKKWAVGKAMILSSLIYGLARGNNLLPPAGDIFLGSAIPLQFSWGYVLFSTVAGYFYTLIYIRTQKITAAAVLHLLVHFIWFAFFRG